MIFAGHHYWLKNAHIPIAFLETKLFSQPTREGLCLVDLEILQGKIRQITPASQSISEFPSLDLKKGIVFPGLIDMHTHLDKGHIWERSPNVAGTFEQALAMAQSDSQQFWKAEDVYRRLEFGLKCSYAHGTTAVRTHIDAFGQQAEISFEVFKSLQKEWSEKLIVQAVSLVSLDYYQTVDGVALADKIAKIDGILGGVAYENPDLERQLDTVFRLAQERGLNLDFHVDENGDPNSACLEKIAAAALRNQFIGQIVCGHCCSLAVQSAEKVKQTLDWVKQAGSAL